MAGYGFWGRGATDAKHLRKRVEDYSDGVDAEIAAKRAAGDSAGVAGATARGMVGTAGKLAGAAYEYGLGHTVFPAAEAAGHAFDAAVDGGKRFWQGLTGDSEPVLPVDSAPVPKVSPKSDVRAKGLGIAAAANQADVPQKQPQDADGGVKPVALGFAGRDKTVVSQPADVVVHGQGQPPQLGMQQQSIPKPDVQTDKQRPFVGVFSAPDDKTRKKLLDAALTPHKGAQNGQLTANQLNTVRGLLAEQDKNGLAREQSAAQHQAAADLRAADHQAALEREWLQQQGGLIREQQRQQADLGRDMFNQAAQDGRFGLQQQQAQQQFDAKLGFERERFAPDLAAAEIKNRQAARLDGLQEAYLSARTPADKAAAAQRLAEANGNLPQQKGFDAERFMKIKRSAVGADGLPVEQDDIVDLQTGKSVLQPPSGARPLPKKGDVVNGYKFKGGNANDEQNWERV